MLDSLEIKNYRILNEVKIPVLAKVNLFTGKNNTGKSTILEAIALYATKFDFNLLYQLLSDRGEYYEAFPENKNVTEANIKTFSSLFTNKVVRFENSAPINIGTLDHSISMRFVKFFEEILDNNDEAGIGRKRTIIEKTKPFDWALHPDIKRGLEILIGKFPYILPLDGANPYNHIFEFDKHFGRENFQFIKSANFRSIDNGQLYDNITLTPKEEYVISALKIIEPKTERIAFVQENSRDRSAVIKLSGSNNILPLQSMGDGINRMLTIILALVNSDNGYCLIDEFENGLHHSVQEKLWEIVFHLSEKLNVQVFATTHSNDCIAGFAAVLNNPQNTTAGKLIRLENKKGKIAEVEFDKDELRIATEGNIEIR